MAGKMHNYARRTPELHYVIEAATDEPDGRHFYMTGNGRGVKAQDFILLQEEVGAVKYQVECIDYYCGMPDYWVAKLVKCLPNPCKAPIDAPVGEQSHRYSPIT